MSFGCSKADSSFTVNSSNYTEEERTAAEAKHLGIPPPAPDLTDNLLVEARKRMAMQLVTQSDRKQSMQNGTYGYGSYSLLK